MEVYNIKFHGNPSSGSYVANAEGLACGQTDRHFMTVRTRLKEVGCDFHQFDFVYRHNVSGS